MSDLIRQHIAVVFLLLVSLAIRLTWKSQTARRLAATALDNAHTDPSRSAIHLAVYAARSQDNSACQISRAIILAALAIVLAAFAVIRVFWNMQ